MVFGGKREDEQWQEVISRRDTQNTEESQPASLLSVENNQNCSSNKIIDWCDDRWVKIRATMDSVMPENMFPRVKLEQKTEPKKFVAASGQQIKDKGEKTTSFDTK